VVADGDLTALDYGGETMDMLKYVLSLGAITIDCNPERHSILHGQCAR
jgi:hypothetical protein